MTSKSIYQGEIGEAIRRTGLVQEVHVYANSSDFPGSHLLLLSQAGQMGTERVPITEELWQKVGVALGYKFKRRPL